MENYLSARPGAAIQASGLVKRFGTTRAVDGLELTVPRGGVFGLLGPNGAGKTTTIQILATLTRPDAGTARVMGHDVAAEPHAVRRQIGVTGQFATVDDTLTGAENLQLQGRLLGLSRMAARARAGALLEEFDLASAARRAVKNYSGGMRRRLDLACRLVVAPALLFLDEPTTGLDPQSRIAVWAIVRQLVSQGTTVLLTTQYLDEADQLSDRIAVLDHGRIIAEGTPGQLKTAAGAGVLRVRLAEPGNRDLARHLLASALGVEVRPDSDPAVLTARIAGTAAGPAADQPGGQDGAAAVAWALARLAGDGIGVAGFSLGQPSLDEVFLALTGHGADSETEEAA
ncbi:MAG TPA: ATP-binding cassette domain-containing protein [Streptosporangiaceae bacterium]|nr:ATP-binding cassette domain-containing protein [Streptosporangiaceae bacterium]